MEAAVTFIAATGNQNKVREFKEILGHCSFSAHIISASEAGVRKMPEETGKTFYENAKLKAEAVCDAVKRNKLFDRFAVLADDSGLTVDALHGAPGVYSARYALLNDQNKPVGPGDAADEDNVSKLLYMLRDIPREQRQAAFICAIVVLTEAGTEYYTEGRMEGEIAFSPRGSGGFGYDPVMFLPEYGCTAAEMDADKKNSVSHRGKAMREMAEKLEKYYFVER